MAQIELNDYLGGPKILLDEVHPGSPHDAWGQSKAQVVVKYQCDWSDRFRARNALLGRSIASTWPATGKWYVRRDLPHAYPKVPWLYATDIVDAEGWEAGGTYDVDGVAVYNKTRLSVLYQSLPYDLLEDGGIVNDTYLGGTPDESLLTRFIVFDQQEATESYTTRSGVWKWRDTGNPMSMEMPMRYARLRLTYTHMHMPRDYVPTGLFALLVGKSNDRDMDAGTWLTGTLRYLGAKVSEAKRNPDDDGTRLVNVQHSFLYAGMTSGVNYFPDPARGNNFFEIWDPVTGNQPFPADDFRQLFRLQNV